MARFCSGLWHIFILQGSSVATDETSRGLVNRTRTHTGRHGAALTEHLNKGAACWKVGLKSKSQTLPSGCVSGFS